MNTEEKSQIVNAALYLEALKNSGYKSTDNAVAEIVDNSIDADSNNVFIIGEQKDNAQGKKSIVSFAFLDDGKGMDYETLKGCLTIGYTTNQERKGLGRFGVGLPQASIFVCDRVEVYSWQNGIDNCMCVHLDADEIKERNLNEIEPPVIARIPAKYKEFIKWRTQDKSFDYSEHGTLVIWTRCTNVDYKKWSTCVKHMAEDLGRKYRYFLYDNSKTISMIELNSKECKALVPNDPLYLMDKSLELAPSSGDVFKNGGYITKEYGSDSDYNESLFEPFNPNGDRPDGKVTLTINYENSGEVKTGEVFVKYSVVKTKYYAPKDLLTETKPGSLPFGSSSSVLCRNTGISVVRNGRELQFGSFGMVDMYNTPQNRWWGVEISFMPDMDAAFGVTNNKQSVDLKPLSKEEMKEAKADDIKTVWHQLAEEIMPTIDFMVDRNTSVRGMKERPSVPTPPPSSQIAEEADNDKQILVPCDKTEEEKLQEASIQLEIEGVSDPSDVEKKQFVDSGVRIAYVDNKSSRDSFVDIAYAAGTLSIIVNKNHAFYKTLIEKLVDDEDDKVSFELFMMSVMKSIQYYKLTYADAMDELLYEINNRIARYMLKYKNNA